MFYVKWGVVFASIGVIVAFLHYALPQRDIVRITEIDVTRMDAGANPDGQSLTRDVRFIFAKYPDGGEMEYRNEDTGWSFPWYFKFDSARLANQAADLKSSADSPRWVVVRHYGWRIPWLDLFPNAIGVREAEGPNENLTPWFNIVFLSSLVIGILVLRRILIILRQRHVDPLVDAIDQELDETAGWWRRQWRRIFGK